MKERREGLSEKSHILPCGNKKNFRLSTMHLLQYLGV